MPWAAEARVLLDKGVYCNNLKDIAKLTEQGTTDADRIAAFVIRHVAWNLASLWDGPVTVTEADQIEAAIRDPLAATLDAVAHKAPTDKIAVHLNALIKAYLSV